MRRTYGTNLIASTTKSCFGDYFLGRCKPSFAAIKTPRGCPSRAASSAAHVLTGMLTERLTVVAPVDLRPALARFPPWVGFGFM